MAIFFKFLKGRRNCFYFSPFSGSMGPDMNLERVQKILAQAGIASRRDAEDMIRDGEVTINGKIAKLGDKADLGRDSIKVRGKMITKKSDPVLYAMYKPRGVIAALKPDIIGSGCIGDYLTKVKERVWPIGRLDVVTEGLILLTNDGEFSQKLQKASGVLKVFEVKVKGEVTAAKLARVQTSYRTEQKIHRCAFVRLKSKLDNKAKIEVGILEGGSFPIRQFFEDRGFLVEKIARIQIGPVRTDDLEPGSIKKLSIRDLNMFFADCKVIEKRVKEDAKNANLFPEDTKQRRPVTTREKRLPVIRKTVSNVKVELKSRRPMPARGSR